MEQSGSSNLGTPVITYVTNGTGSPAVAATNDMPARPAYSSEVWKAALDDAVFRILTQMNKAGLLEGTQYGTHSNGCDRSGRARTARRRCRRGPTSRRSSPMNSPKAQ